MDKKLKVYESYLDGSTIMVDNMLESKEMTLDEIMDYIRGVKCKELHSPTILIYHKDVEGKGCPLDKEASRETFDSNPAVYGIAVYKNWANMVVFE